MKFTAKEIMRYEEQNVLQFLDGIVTTKKYKADKISKFLMQLVTKYGEVAKQKEDYITKLIEKYGTEEEIAQKALKEDSPHKESAISEYNTFMEVWEKTEIEVDTDITLDFFDSGICWTANAVRNQLMINEVFGR